MENIMDKTYQSIFERMENLLTKASEQQKGIETKFETFKLTQNEIESKLIEINNEFEKQISEFKELSSSLIDVLKDSSQSLSKDFESKIEIFLKDSDLTIKTFQERSKELLSAIEKRSSSIFDPFEDIINNKANSSEIDSIKKDISQLNNRITQLEKYTHKHKIFGGKI
jgi:phage-related minor tail protein